MIYLKVGFAFFILAAIVSLVGALVIERLTERAAFLFVVTICALYWLGIAAVFVALVTLAVS
jgi:hypothetical protein